MLRRALIGLATLAVACGAALFSAAAPAFAACSDEDFNARWISSSTLGSGTQNDIYIRNRSLTTNCNGAAAFSTALVGDDSSPRFAEIGWVERWTNGAGSNHQWDLFWEYNDGTAVHGGFNSGVSVSCCSWYRFRVRYDLSDGNGWKFFYDPGANGNFIQLGGLVHPGFTQGNLKGETSRYPTTETSLRDHQRNLRWIQCGSGCSWQDWTDNRAQTSAPSGWHWVRSSATEHYMCPDSDPSGPC